jgi:hypothetical protein
MKRLPVIGLTGCAIALASAESAFAMPAATPYALGGAVKEFIQIKGGHGHGHGWGHHGGHGHHYGWVPWAPLWLAASSPLVVTFPAGPKTAIVGGHLARDRGWSLEGFLNASS